MQTATCQHCRTEFEIKWPRNPNRYCSKTCSNRANARSGEANPNWSPPAITACATCGAEVVDNPSANRKYCSRECQLAYTRTLTGESRYNFKGAPKEMACEVCGTKRTVRYSLQHRYRACSRACAGILGLRSWPRTSTLEVAMAEAFSSAGMSPEMQYALGRCTLDFAFPEQRLAVECDGVYWHGLADVAARDRRRDYWLRAQGWSVLRLTEAEIRESPNACVEKVQKALMRTRVRT